MNNEITFEKSPGRNTYQVYWGSNINRWNVGKVVKTPTSWRYVEGLQGPNLPTEKEVMSAFYN